MTSQSVTYSKKSDRTLLESESSLSLYGDV